MAIADAAAYVVAELVAYVVRRVTGRVFRLQPKTAQRVGEWSVIALIACAGLTVTLLYS